jgi:Tfp pilus assembly protein PilX
MQTNVSLRHRTKQDSRGFALIAVLLLLLILSGIAVALMFTVNTEQHLQRNDSGNGLAYYGAEAGMEKMMSDLGDLYDADAAPNAATVAAIACPPNIACPNQPIASFLNGTNFTDYSINVPLAADGVSALCNSGAVSGGPNQGLIAETCPMTLNVTALRPSGEEVKMVRQVEVALIPVFQFGVFSSSDLSYFAGPTFDFSGRVQTNGNLFLAANTPGPTTFHGQIRAAFDVVRDTLANGLAITTSGHTQPVYIPTTAGGCPQGGGAVPGCRALQYTGPNEGSAFRGTLQPPFIPTAGGIANNNAPPSDWSTISTGAPPNGYAGNILSGSTGATPLNLPFVKGNVQPIEIIRRGIAGEGKLTATSRLYNKAQIRVLLSDDPSELGPNDGQNIRLANSGGLPFTVPTGAPGYTSTFIAEEKTAVDGDWTGEGYTGVASGGTSTKNLIDGYLRVEYRDSTGAYHPVTTAWLALGFARRQAIPDDEHFRPNNIHPQAILLFQQPRDSSPGPPPVPLPNPTTKNDWYPINMYDQREGGFRDVDDGNCRINGVMNLVDIDVHNLARWLAVNPQVEGVSQNGYILYFSDRRGMLPDANPFPPYDAFAPIKTGAYGFDDVVNEANSDGSPNSVLDQGEAANPAGTVNFWGQANLGQGFSATGAAILPPNITLPCATGRKNWVSGARHGVRLVNGSQLGSLVNGTLPIRPVAISDPNNTGGFTLASENPAYIVANYNASDANAAGTGFVDPHASAAVIADTVSLLSNLWSDANSFAFPTHVASRPASNTAGNAWFRVAIASGKNRNFSWNATASLPSGLRPSTDFGTDGGVHNFLRFLESWGGQRLNYTGSMVSLYYSAYATGVFKCCKTVYAPPSRGYAFDIEFQALDHLPPGTPRFEDVVNLGFRQDFTNR